MTDKTITTPRSGVFIGGVEYVPKDSVKREAVIAPTEANPTPMLTGKAYLIRTVTMTLTGRVIGVVGQFLCLVEAAWIADTGRFSDALKTGKLNEVEPVEGRVSVGLGSIVDAYEWKHDLPRVQK